MVPAVFASLMVFELPLGTVLGGPKVILGWKPLFAKKGDTSVDTFIALFAANSASGSHLAQSFWRKSINWRRYDNI